MFSEAFKTKFVVSAAHISFQSAVLTRDKQETLDEHLVLSHLESFRIGSHHSRTDTCCPKFRTEMKLVAKSDLNLLTRICHQNRDWNFIAKEVAPFDPVILK